MPHAIALTSSRRGRGGGRGVTVRRCRTWPTASSSGASSPPLVDGLVKSGADGLRSGGTQVDPSDWRLSEEMPALPAVIAASPAAAIKPVLRVLPEPTPGTLDLMPLGTSSELLTVFRSRCNRVFLLRGRIAWPPFSAWSETPSQSRRRARL